MEFTCLSEGSGSNFPASHILDISGFKILLDCPLDLSTLGIFTPIPLKSNVIDDDKIASCFCENNEGLVLNDENNHKSIKTFDAKCLIHAEPRYRTVKNMQLFNTSFIDVVLISSPMGMLGLPFLTRCSDFSAKVYATDATAKIGQLIMEDLVNMHKEYTQFYGPECVVPQWMAWDELESLPKELKHILFGEFGTKFGSFMPLYSAADVKACMVNVRSLKLAEEACYDGTLILKAFSSGLEIGSCNWTISCPKGSITWISNAIFSSSAAMSFDHAVAETTDTILYSDFSCLNCPGKVDDSSSFVGTDVSNSSASLQGANEYLELMEKIDFICSCSIDSIRAGGSVLIPLGRIGVILMLLEQFSRHLVSEDVKVPIFVISSVAEELISFSSIIPEWLCSELQNQLYSGHPLFNHQEMLKDGRIHVFSSVHSVQLLKIWQEPCIIFCPHWSLRLGPAVPLLRRWSGDKNSLIVLDEDVDAELAFLPFKPLELKVLQCSFISNSQLDKTRQLLKTMQPRHILLPETLRDRVGDFDAEISLSYYSENKKTCIPYTKYDPPVLEIDEELAQKLQFVTFKRQEVKVSKLKGVLNMVGGRYELSLGNEVYIGHNRTDANAFVSKLRNEGMIVSVEKANEISVVRVFEPWKAVIELRETETLVTTDDENFSIIAEALCGMFV